MNDRVRRWAPLAILILAIGIGVVPFLKKGTSELPVYELGGERMLAGEEIYHSDDAKPFTYPPFFAVPFVPFAWLPDSVDVRRGAWYFVNVGLLVAIVVLLRSIVRPSLGDRSEKWFWVAVTALSARHVLAVFQNQSHDLVIALAVTLAAWRWSRGDGLRAGLWAGLGGACKATPLLFGLPFVMQRRVRPVIGIGVGFAAFSLLPDLLFPRVDGGLWIVAWYETIVAGVGVGDAAAQAGVWNAGSILNQSLSGTLHRLTTELEPGLRILNVAPVHLSDGARKVVILIAQLGVLAVIATASWRRKGVSENPAIDRLGLAAIVACGMVLLSPMSSKSHFCVLLLPAAHGVAVLFRRRDPVVLVLLIASFLVGTATTKGIFGRETGEWFLACGAVTWGALLMLLASAHAVFWSPRARLTPN